MLKWQAWEINYWPGGWVRAVDETGVTVVLRYLPAGEGDSIRMRLHTALMTSVEPITPRRWRDLPLAEIEKFFVVWQRAHPEEFAQLIQPSERDPLSLDEIKRFFDETPSMKIGAHIPTSQVIDDEMAPHVPWEVVRRPQGGRITDDFLDNLASVYRFLVNRGESAPAAWIAKEAGVPVGTVHRWISRARKSGFLPPAVKGKAG